MKAASSGPSLFDVDAGFPEGFIYRPAFLTDHEAISLLDQIRELSFHDVRMHGVTARRRVRQYGWNYSFDGASLCEGEPLPGFLEPFRQRAAALAAVPPDALSETLVTEYSPGATIGWHRDAPAFGVVVGISLGASCRFRLRRPTPDGFERLALELEPGSAYVIAGQARSAWQHSIPAVSGLRYSITFRTLRRNRQPAPGT